MDNGELVPPVNEEDHQAGHDDAPVTLVEFGDYQCPYCRSAYPVVEAVRLRLGNQLRFVWRQFPLEQVHPLARQAAEASEAAGAQAAFWAMHEALLSDPMRLESDDLIQHARDNGIDEYRFRGELQDHTYAPEVDADIDSGIRSGVPGTPTFFVNGRMYDGPRDVEGMTDALIAAAREAVLQRGA